MSYILVIMTIVGTAYELPIRDWRPIGEFQTMEACRTAGNILKREPQPLLPYKDRVFVCLPK